jgi:membrane protein YqaA with SNARE-associated domain
MRAMPDPAIAAALVVLVALVEASPIVRLPIGLLLAISLLAADAQLLPIALLGALGVTVARLGIALAARRGRDRSRRASPAALAQREALRRHLSGSRAYARTSFFIAALPGVPASFFFPLLGAMRAPLWPAIAGTIVGRTPVLALTAALFTWLGRLGEGTDSDAAVALGVFTVVLLVFRTVQQVDWAHRAATGGWRWRDPSGGAVRMTTTMFGDATGGPHGGWERAAHGDEHDIVEGELLGEEVEDDDDRSSDDDMPPPALPPTGLAPS